MGRLRRKERKQPGRAADSQASGPPSSGACYFCGNPTPIIRTVRRLAAELSYCRVIPARQLAESACYVCGECDAGSGPVLLTPQVTWHRSPIDSDKR